MQYNVTDFDSSGKPATKQIGTFTRWTCLYIQVQGPQTVRFAQSQQELAQPQPGQSGVQGLQLTMAATAQPFPLWWIGELWAISSAPCQVEIVILSTPGYPGLGHPGSGVLIAT